MHSQRLDPQSEQASETTLSSQRHHPRRTPSRQEKIRTKSAKPRQPGQTPEPDPRKAKNQKPSNPQQYQKHHYSNPLIYTKLTPISKLSQNLSGKSPTRILTL